MPYHLFLLCCKTSTKGTINPEGARLLASHVELQRHWSLATAGGLGVGEGLV